MRTNDLLSGEFLCSSFEPALSDLGWPVGTNSRLDQLLDWKRNDTILRSISTITGALGEMRDATPDEASALSMIAAGLYQITNGAAGVLHQPGPVAGQNVFDVLYNGMTNRVSARFARERASRQPQAPPFNNGRF